MRNINRLCLASLSVFIFTILLFPSAALAQTASPSFNPTRQQQRQQHQEEIQLRRTQRQQEIINNISQRYSRAVVRLRERVSRMNGFISRLRERAAGISGQGEDTSAASAALDAAQSLLTQAETELAGLEALIADLQSDSQPQETAVRFRAKTKEIIDLFHQTQAQLVETVHALRGSINSQSP